MSFGRQNNVGGSELPKSNHARFVGINSSAATYVGIGLTPTNFGTLANANQSDTSYVASTTAASAGSIAGEVTTQVAEPGMLPSYHIVMKTPSTITNLRFWIGLSNGTPANADDPGVNSILFRYSTVAGDTGWVPSTRNSTTQTLGTTIVTVAADTVYRMTIRFATSTKVAFSINGSSEQYMTATIPSSGTSINITAVVYTTEAVSKTINISRIMVDAQ
jgi:hypothetical protein